MQNALLQKYITKNLRAKPVAFRPGDTIKVHVKIKEGDKERLQVFEGVVHCPQQFRHQQKDRNGSARSASARALSVFSRCTPASWIISIWCEPARSAVPSFTICVN